MDSSGFKRKLTAILSADVGGYSRLMGNDEAATVKTLETYKGVMFSLIKQHRGRVVDSPGDNLLAEFGSVVDAVQCAVSIQKELQTRNAYLPENRRMEFRIGINLGDVIEEDDRIYGDGVNIAARLEALADPGGICVSKTAFDHIESKLPFVYRFIGDQTVKNIAKPVGAYKVLMETRVVDARTKREAKAVSFWRRKTVLSIGIIMILAIVAILYWNFYPRGKTIEPASIEPEQTSSVPEIKEAPKTIAVLPFDDLSPEKDQEYFVLGLSEEILNSLTKIPNLLVTARTSSFAFKGTDKKVQDIARELGVDNILEGSVRKAGNSIRITTQLIRAIDGFHLWSETYNRELDDIFQIQEEIANSVAEKLKLTLEALNLSGGTENIKAYELYLVAKGIRLGSDLNKGIELIDEAISLDQNFALAWAQKSNLHLALAAQVTSPDRASALLDLGFYEAQKTIEIEPNLGKGYLTLGLAHYKRNEFIKAEEAYNKGIELTTEYIDYLEYFLNMHYMSVGYFKKCHALLEEIKRKDPLSSDLFWSYIVNFGCMGDMAHAEIEYNRGKELFGDEWFAGTVFINLMRLLNKDISSLSINEMPKNIVANPIWEKSIKNLKSPEKGLSELRILFGNNNFGSIQLFELAGWAANFGDPELSLRAIEKAVNLQTMGSFSIWTPVMQEVRQLPRFKEFIREIGLVDYWKQYGWPDLCRPVGDDDFVCN